MRDFVHRLPNKGGHSSRRMQDVPQLRIFEMQLRPDTAFHAELVTAPKGTSALHLSRVASSNA